MLNFLYYSISFILAAFFLFFGLLGILLSLSITMRTELVGFFLEHTIAIGLFGFGFLVIGAIMLATLWFNTKHRYYWIRTGPRSVKVDEVIIQHYVDAYWKKLFPNEEIPCRLILKKNRIKVIANLPYKASEERKTTLNHIQDELKEILMQVLGYPHEFSLALSFAKKSA